MAGQINTANKFDVAPTGIGMVRHDALPGYLSSDDALNLAAWLVVVADPEATRFQEVLEAIQVEAELFGQEPSS